VEKSFSLNSINYYKTTTNKLTCFLLRYNFGTLQQHSEFTLIRNYTNALFVGDNKRKRIQFESPNTVEAPPLVDPHLNKLVVSEYLVKFMYDSVGWPLAYFNSLFRYILSKFSRENFVMSVGIQTFVFVTIC